MTCYFIEPRTRKYVIEYGLLSFAIRLSERYGEKLFETDTKTGLEGGKTQSYMSP